MKAKPPEPWIERDGQARPTRERFAHGDIAVVETARAGVRLAVDRHASPAMRAFALGHIDRGQLEAAHHFERLYRATVGTGTGRDCLDPSPRGRDEWSDTEAERHAGRQKKLYALRDKLGREGYDAMVLYCVFHEPLVDARRLRVVRFFAALDLAAGFFQFERGAKLDGARRIA